MSKAYGFFRLSPLSFNQKLIKALSMDQMTENHKYDKFGLDCHFNSQNFLVKYDFK